MAITFAGLLRWAAGAPTEADVTEMRRTGQPPAALAEKVRQLPRNLPPTAKLVTSHLIASHDLISVLVIEAESVDDLRAIGNYYAGWFTIDWYPTNVVARD